MHIFLTGEKQVGKTAAINTFLTSSGISVDGFLTRWEFKNSKRQGLYLCSISTGKRYLLATSISVSSTVRAGLTDNITEVFNIHGTGILKRSGKRDCIIMDELGVLEERAGKFKTAVIQCLDGDVPVLGVVAKKTSPFLDKIRNHPRVRLIEITEENRDFILTKMNCFDILFNTLK